MLTKFKSYHIKKILWGLILIIIPAFILWGSLSYFTSRKKNIIGKIGNHQISTQEFRRYLELARLHYMLLSLLGGDYFRGIKTEQIEGQAWKFYLLLAKAKKDNIEVSDEEVVEGVKKMFSQKDKFDKEWYFRFLKYRLKIEPRTFEEYIRNTLKIQKLLDKYVKVSVTDKEILDLYKKDNQKAKIAYLLIPYEKFEKELKIEDKNLRTFYENNRESFKEEPKVKIRYIFISDEDYPDLKKKLNQAWKRAKNIETISKNLNLPFKDTDFLGLNSPIPGIGWEPQIIQLAFSLPKKSLSKILEVSGGVVILEKIDQKETFIPAFEEIKPKVKERLKEDMEKKLAQDFGEKIVNEIETGKVNKLEAMAKSYKLEYKKTDYFKYYDYVEGVGLNPDVNQAIFNTPKGKIIPKPFALSKGVYIIQVEDIISIQEDKFKKEKQAYRQKILAKKQFMEQLLFISKIEKELNLKIYTSLTSSTKQ